MRRWMFLMTMVLVAPATAAACEPEPQQLCGRSAWAGAAVRGSIAVPGASQTADLGIDLTGALKWGSDPAEQGDCNQPVNVQAVGSLVCRALAGGAEVARSDWDESIAVPPGDGPWDLSAVEALMVLPEGAPGEPSLCTLEGRLEVTFETDGQGLGDVVAHFGADLSVLERAGAEPTRPRLAVSRLLPTAGASTWNAGDESLLWFSVENLDPDAAVDVDYTFASQGLATFPESDDVQGLDFALGGDGGLSLALASQVTSDLVGGGDPADAVTSLSGSFSVPAGEGTVLLVVARSAARCPDDSGANVRFTVDGDWGVDQASATASVVVRQGLTSPRSPLCVITDSLNTAATVDGRWGPTRINGAQWLSSHTAGNLPFGPEGYRTRVPGFSFAEPYPNPNEDVLRVPEHPTSISWSADFVPTQIPSAGEIQHLEVEVTNLGDVDALNLPAIYDTGAAGDFDYSLDAGAGLITLTDRDSGTVRFQGSLSDFFSATPPGLTMDLDTIRQFTFDCAQQGSPLLLPRSSEWVKTLTEDDPRAHVELLDRRSGAGLDWTAAVLDGPATLVSDAGTATQDLRVTAALDDLPEWPLHARVRVSVVTAAVNSPLEVVLLLAREPEQAGDDDDATQDDDDSAGLADDDDVTLDPDPAPGCDCGQTDASALVLVPLLGWRRRRCS